MSTYVNTHYKVSEQNDGMIALDFVVGNGRGQRVWLWRVSLLDGLEEWVQIESAVGKIKAIDLAAAMDLTETTVVGALAKFKDLLTFRHSVPLADLQISEFERPLHLVVTTADRLEAKLTGADIF